MTSGKSTYSLLPEKEIKMEASSSFVLLLIGPSL